MRLIEGVRSRRQLEGPRTLYDMIWSEHLVDEQPDGTWKIYIDRHIAHEVDSPQAFAGLRRAGLTVQCTGETLLVVDHNVPTSDRTKPNPDPESAAQIAYLAENARLFGLEYYDELDKRQGICHVVGPEQGFALPGVTLVCGDSHAATHGAFGALAFGIGTSGGGARAGDADADPVQVEEHARGRGRPPAAERHRQGPHILAIIGEIGAAGGTGYALEYAGEAIRALSMEGRIDGLQHVGGGGRPGPA